jgi:hypothetical protein
MALMGTFAKRKSLRSAQQRAPGRPELQKSASGAKAVKTGRSLLSELNSSDLLIKQVLHEKGARVKTSCENQVN